MKEVRVFRALALEVDGLPQTYYCSDKRVVSFEDYDSSLALKDEEIRLLREQRNKLAKAMLNANDFSCSILDCTESELDIVIQEAMKAKGGGGGTGLQNHK